MGMPLTATHAPLLTLHMLWVDLSKCFMTFSRAVGQLLQARRGMPAQMRKAVWNLHSRPTEDSRSAQLFVETSRTSLLGRFYLALGQTESYTYPCNIIAELRTTTTHEEVRSLAAIGTQHQGTFTAIHYRAPQAQEIPLRQW